MTALEKINTLQDYQQLTEIIVYRYLQFKEGRTKIEYQRNLKAFFAWLNAQDEPVINPSNLHSYKMHLENAKGLKVNSVNVHISVLKDFCKWCAEMEYLAHDPSKYLRRAKHKDITKVDKARQLTAQEVQQLFKATNKDTVKDFADRIYLLMLFNLGLRVHEAMKVKLEDIDLEEGIIKIIGKGNKLRILGTNTVLLKEIKEYIEVRKPMPNDYLIVSSKGTKGKPCTRQHGHRVLKAISRKAGIDMTDIKSHSGRVTAINFLLDADTPLRDVANFAGHSNINTTRMYDRKDDRKVIETCNIISFIDDE